jgi:hypothetical protein
MSSRFYKVFATAVIGLNVPYSMPDIIEINSVFPESPKSKKEILFLGQTSSLTFGEIIPSAEYGVISLMENGTKVAGGITKIGQSDPAAFSVFSVFGGSELHVHVSSHAMLYSGNNQIPLSTYTYLLPEKLDSSGTAKFFIGGVLHISPNQAPGLYVGSYEVSVAV